MKLRIAFCGPNFDLCDTLARQTQDLLYGSASDAILLDNPLKDVLEVSRRQKFEGADLDWMNLWTTTVRRMILDGAREAPVVISASCGLDQVIFQATWVAEQLSRPSTSLVLADAQGNPLFDDENQAMVNRSGSVLQVILNSTEEEVIEFWDYIYAVMPVSSSLSATPNVVVDQYQDFLTSVPAFIEKVTILPDSLAAAGDALRSEVALWKATLSSSS